MIQRFERFFPEGDAGNGSKSLPCGVLSLILALRKPLTRHPKCSSKSWYKSVYIAIVL